MDKEVSLKLTQHSTPERIVENSDAQREHINLIALGLGRLVIMKHTSISEDQYQILNSATLDNYDARNEPQAVKRAIDRGEIPVASGEHEMPTEFTELELAETEDTEIRAFWLMMEEGKEPSEIAEELSISIQVVRRHLNELTYKLRARNSSHAVLRGYEVGLFDTSD